jgi:hypothetical protein
MNFIHRLAGCYENTTVLGKKLCPVEPLSTPTALKEILDNLYNKDKIMYYEEAIKEAEDALAKNDDKMVEIDREALVTLKNAAITCNQMRP